MEVARALKSLHTVAENPNAGDGPCTCTRQSLYHKQDWPTLRNITFLLLGHFVVLAWHEGKIWRFFSILENSFLLKLLFTKQISKKILRRSFLGNVKFWTLSVPVCSKNWSRTFLTLSYKYVRKLIQWFCSVKAFRCYWTLLSWNWRTNRMFADITCYMCRSFIYLYRPHGTQLTSHNWLIEYRR